MNIIKLLLSYPWHFYLSAAIVLFVTIFGVYAGTRKVWIWDTTFIKPAGWVMATFAFLLFICCMLFKFAGVEFQHMDLTYAVLSVPMGLAFMVILWSIVLEEAFKRT